MPKMIDRHRQQIDKHRRQIGAIENSLRIRPRDVDKDWLLEVWQDFAKLMIEMIDNLEEEKDA